jgi:hypothetical protein
MFRDCCFAALENIAYTCSLSLAPESNSKTLTKSSSGRNKVANDSFSVLILYHCFRSLNNIARLDLRMLQLSSVLQPPLSLSSSTLPSKLSDTSGEAALERQEASHPQFCGMPPNSSTDPHFSPKPPRFLSTISLVIQACCKSYATDLGAQQGTRGRLIEPQGRACPNALMDETVLCCGYLSLLNINNQVYLFALETLHTVPSSSNIWLRNCLAMERDHPFWKGCATSHFASLANLGQT